MKWLATVQRMCRAPGRRRLAAAVLTLTLALFAPLLRGGTVWLLDSPATLLGPVPHLPASDLGYPPGLANGLPVDATLLGLFHTLPWGWLRLLPLLLVPAVAAWGFRRLLGPRVLATVPATLLYVVNPFVYQRATAGQIYLLLAYALLPLLVGLLVASAGPSRGTDQAVQAGLVLALIAALGISFAPVAAVPVAIAAVVRAARREWAALRRIGLAMLVAAGACAYWLVPATGLAGQAGRLTPAQLAAFATVPDPRLGMLANVLGLYGFWFQGPPLPKDNLVGWPLFLAAILLVAVLGGLRARRRPGTGAVAVILVGSGVVGLTLALGTWGPTGPAFRWLFVHVAPFRVMREPEKFLALLALGYAAGFGLGVQALAGEAGSRWLRTATVLLLLSLPCVYTFRMFWGFDGYVRPSMLPTSWIQAAALVDHGPAGSVLVLPWDEYLPYPWTGERTVANPMASLFDRNAIVSGNPDMGPVPARTVDPFTERVQALVDRGDSVRNAGRALAPLGVRFVALQKVADWRAYAWLYRQRDLRLVRSWPDLALFRNAASGIRTGAAPPRAASLGLLVAGGGVSGVVLVLCVVSLGRASRRRARGRPPGRMRSGGGGPGVGGARSLASDRSTEVIEARLRGSAPVSFRRIVPRDPVR